VRTLIPLLMLSLVATVAFGQPVVTTIYDIQNGTIPPGTHVQVNNVVVTAGPYEFTSTGAYCFVEEQAGGMYSGIEVYWGSDQADVYGGLQRGCLVRITGVTGEYYDMTEIDISAPGDTLVVVGEAAVPGPDLVTTAGMMAEEWEGVLVQTLCATVTNPDLGYGEWEIDDGSGPGRVDDKGQITYVPTLGDCNIYTGILAYSYGNYKLWPRDDNDIVGCGPSANEPTQWGSIKALYR